MTCNGCIRNKRVQSFEERAYCNMCCRAYAGADADMYEDRYEAAPVVEKTIEIDSVCNGCGHKKAEKTAHDRACCSRCQRTYLGTSEGYGLKDMYETAEQIEEKVKKFAENVDSLPSEDELKVVTTKVKVKHNIVRHLLSASALMLLYCIVWMATEYIAKGSIQNDPVDNIMMLLLIPVFLLATKDQGTKS